MNYINRGIESISKFFRHNQVTPEGPSKVTLKADEQMKEGKAGFENAVKNKSQIHPSPPPQNTTEIALCAFSVITPKKTSSIVPINNQPSPITNQEYNSPTPPLSDIASRSDSVSVSPRSLPDSISKKTARVTPINIQPLPITNISSRSNSNSPITLEKDQTPTSTISKTQVAENIKQNLSSIQKEIASINSELQSSFDFKNPADEARHYLLSYRKEELTQSKQDLLQFCITIRQDISPEIENSSDINKLERSSDLDRTISSLQKDLKNNPTNIRKLNNLRAIVDRSWDGVLETLLSQSDEKKKEILIQIGNQNCCAPEIQKKLREFLLHKKPLLIGECEDRVLFLNQIKSLL